MHNPAKHDLAEDPRHPGALIHPTSIVDDDTLIGAGTRVWHFCHILTGAAVGEGCSIGQNCMIGPQVTIGNHCKIQNNVSLYKGVELADNVFCGPSCVFTNVRSPRAHISRSCSFESTKVAQGATIGANATIICGYSIGAYAFIAAGAVVTKNVPAFALIIGNPGRRIGWVSQSGERLGPDLICPGTGEKYIETEPGHLRLSL